MSKITRKLFKWGGAAFVLLLVAAIAAPYLSADMFADSLRASLERALGGKRQVELDGVHFSLFKGPALSIDRVTIHEDPAVGAEPLVYVRDSGASLQVAPSVWALLAGRFEISSLRLDGARINLSKSGPASEWGQWNFDSFVNRSFMAAAPAIHIRNSRINFKFGDTKSLLYLTETDLDISPPRTSSGGWDVTCSAKTARTDRTAYGLSAFTINGKWFVNPERVDLNLETDHVGLEEFAALFRGDSGGLHGYVTSHFRLTGPIDNIGIAGNITIGDVHRWDLLPPHGQGWPLDVRGKLNLGAQQLDLESNSASNAPLPVLIRFSASNYLRQPRWSVSMDWNRFPVEPFVELARHMGVSLPPKLVLSGTMDGGLSYSSETGFQGRLAIQNAALTVPDSPPVRFDDAHLLIDKGHAQLSPSVVRISEGEQANIEADYDMSAGALDLSISADNLKVSALRTQVALAAVPWLEQLSSGVWSGTLRYRTTEARNGWSGRLDIKDAVVPLPGVSSPLEMSSASARIEGFRVTLQKMNARIGKLQFTGDYAYEPAASRPHRFHIRSAQVDAGDLEREFTPTLRRAGLLSQALGRAAVPDWLRTRLAEGSLQIDDLIFAGRHLQKFRARLEWNGVRVQLDELQATLDRAALAGRLAINLRGGRPSYTLNAKLKGLPWQSGTVDAEGVIDTNGSGAQLLSNMTSQGSFMVTGADLGFVPSARTFSGKYNLEWWQSAPRLRLTAVNLRTADDNFTGKGSTEEDGRIVVLLSSGSKEARVSGTLGNMRLEETAP
jgi:hypothetical protein